MPGNWVAIRRSRRVPRSLSASPSDGWATDDPHQPAWRRAAEDPPPRDRLRPGAADHAGVQPDRRAHGGWRRLVVLVARPGLAAGGCRPRVGAAGSRPPAYGAHRSPQLRNDARAIAA